MDASVRGIRISNPARIIYPKLGFSKLDLVRYYDRVAERMLPHVVDRPLTLVHCPDGLNAPCNYMRHRKVWGPDVLRRVTIQEKTKVGEYLAVDNIEGVIALAQMGVVEIHTWNSTTADIERPNRLVWDFDPGPTTRFADVVAAAKALRALLETLGLESWLKTTGGHGLHVVAPIVPHRQWDECLEFARAVAAALAATDPQLYTITFAKHGRESKILIDYLRNNRTNTSVCAYSARARESATISMPIGWAQLSAGLKTERYTVKIAPAALEADPWRDYWKARQKISKAAFDAIRRMSAAGTTAPAAPTRQSRTGAKAQLAAPKRARSRGAKAEPAAPNRARSKGAKAEPAAPKRGRNGGAKAG
ncbi:MAG TPA: non-homologous end-joining DNA ligase [Vicinamibacterales bacterium]|nr:non-homologous end-joining DNA ligase [Vicinamibacterales bacterium]